MISRGFDLRVLAVIFVVSRIVFRLLGIQFDTSPLDWFYQFLDPMLLKTDLIRSIVFLHAQPPAFNIFLGAVLALGHHIAPAIFALIYMAFGLMIVLLLYRLLRNLEVPRSISLGACTFFMLSPPVILFENWLFYTYPVTLFVVYSACLLYDYLDRPRKRTLMLFFITLSFIVLTRTLFHTVWFIAVAFWLIFMRRQHIKQIILCALAPFLLISAFHAKNLVIFRQANLSSWFGMNIAKMTLTVPFHTLNAEIEKGKVSAIVLIEPFGDPEEYQDFADFNVPTGVPVLDMQHKTTGYTNFNHIAYISVSQQYLTAARYLIFRYPHHYLLSIIKALYAFLQPCSDDAIFVHENRNRIICWTTVYEDVLCGNQMRSLWHATFTNRYGDTRIVHINFLFFVIPFIILWGLYRLWKSPPSLPKRTYLTYMYVIGTIMYVTVVGNALEMSENMRFRFLVVPFFYILFSLLFKQIINKTAKT
jgi:hypothetical protein